MDVVNILTLVIKHMTSVENIIKLKGDEKKEFVINLLQKQLPNYSDYAELIPVIIELVIILSRQSIPINKRISQFSCW